jgi:hypothetical protein
MKALGDIKQLQHHERQVARAIDKLIDPPLDAPAELRTAKVSQLPGDTMYTNRRTGEKGILPILNLDPRIREMEFKSEQIRSRIRRYFKEDLFLTFTQNQGSPEKTATEVQAIDQEKLLVLGNVLQQMDQTFNSRFIDLLFNYRLKQGKVAPPPPELQGSKIEVEYISIMHSAQKLVPLVGIERFTNYCLSLGQVNPDWLKKFNADQMIDFYSELTSIPPGGVRSDDEVALLREEEAKQIQAQQMALMAKQSADTMKTLSSTQTTGDNALTEMTGGQ